MRRAFPFWAPYLAGVVLVAGWLTIALIMLARSPGWRTVDLEVYQLGGSALLHGADPYSIHPSGSPLSFTYPPFAAVVFAPVSLLSAVTARVLVTVATMAALGYCVSIVLRRMRPGVPERYRYALTLAIAGVALFIQPVYGTVMFGQINVLLLTLVLADTLGARTRLPRGVLVGLATAVKLTPGVFILYYLVTRRWRAARNAAGVVAASIALGFALSPGSSWNYWTNLVFDDQRVGGVEYVGNQSLRGLLARLTGDADQLVAVWALAALAVLVGGLTLAARIREQRGELAGVLVCATTGLLVSPISWDHHWVWAVPVGIVLWTRALGGQAALRLVRLLAACAWTVVFYSAVMWHVPDISGQKGVWDLPQLLDGNAYLLAGLAFLAGTARALARSRAAEPEASAEPVPVSPG